MARRNTGAITQAPSENQDTKTPPELIHAVEKAFGKIEWDLAASEWNKVSNDYLDEATDSLTVPWHCLPGCGSLWLNPPFERIEPWAKKCFEESQQKERGRIIMLAPAATDTGYFRDWVIGKCILLFLNGRIVFIDPRTQEPHKRQSVCVCADKPNKKWKCKQRECGSWVVSPYPKSTMLCIFDRRENPSIGTWDWKEGSPILFPINARR